MDYNHSKLNNGIQVVTCNMPNFRSVAINIIVNVGSRNESFQENGISHFLEHMAFKGTTSRTSKQIAEEFDNIGGHFNAYTSREQTVYHAKVLSEYTEKAIDILADILQNSVYNKEDILKEQSVITQEIAQTLDNPDDLAYEKLLEVAYVNQPIGRSILGTVENITKFDKDILTQYIDKHYFAENIVISAAGDIEHSKIVDLANNYFNNIKSNSNYISNKKVIKANYTNGHSIIDKDLEQVSYMLAYEGISYKDIHAYYTAQLMSIIFGGGISSRLFQEVRENRGLAYSVGSFMSSYNDTGLFMIHAGAGREHLSELVKVINQEKEQICLNITQEELDRAKAQVRSSLLMADEKTGYKSEEIGKNYSIFGRFFLTKDILEVIDSVTTKDIINIAGKIFSSKASISLVGPDLKDINYKSFTD
jgi:predicted Zn-dependent peptidase